ncbi:hypothetical protein B0A49_10703 [Cryomyces minteri]|uniref:Xylanolytic transcriptional activator regulatory domain-containing protein n=1 Tax=Cryomyces minteri TaxID=331657 RepID=A0A4U0WSL7_9PEZI|nr:hypothetical protein B0A49_10703 [Cryomyces minteri]
MQVMERLNEILEVATRSYDLIASPQSRHKGGSQTPSVNTADVTSASGMRLSRPADPSADAVPERQSSPGQNDLPEHEMEATSEPVEEPEEEPEDAVESIPAEHDTAAHKLILLWPTIAEFTRNVAPSPNYPLEADEKRGLLRLYGRGEGTGEQDEETQGDSSSPASIGSPTEDSSSVPSPSEAVWGYTYKLDVPPSIVVRRPELYSAGGLNQDQSLKLEAPIVRYLVDSYYRNMHILHPFIDKKTMDRRIELFIKRHNPNATTSRSPFALAGVQSGAEPHRSGQRLKRKYSDETVVTFGRPAGSEATKPPSRPIERSINSAIILLMLAIGKVCLHKDSLPGAVPSRASTAHCVSSPSINLESPSAATKASPASSHSPSVPNMVSPSHDGDLFNTMSRGCFVDELQVLDKRDSAPRNVDVIPGLAYYAIATEILGTQLGGNDLCHAQAFLLAGLYAGQLARVMESWTWINAACRACRILVRREGLAHEPVPLPLSKRKDLTKLAFWTCLQLESDILAELDLPSSGISRYEDNVSLPLGIMEDMPQSEQAPDSSQDAETVMLYYSAQIQLRKILNRTHTALYNAKYTTKSRLKGWTALGPTELERQLKEWRDSLPSFFKWEDKDPPAREINAARMRAKYYGARYIINRTFLDYALHVMDPQRKNKPLLNAQGQRRTGVEPLFKLIGQLPEQSIKDAAKICVESAMSSTVAFDNIATFPNRLIITNIFGTAHA